MNILFYLILPLLLLIFTVTFLRLLINFLRKKSYLDFPVERSNHKNPTPKSGGIVVIPLIIIFIFIYVKSGYIESNPWILFCSLSIILYFFSLLDDIYNLPILPRIFIQLICVIIGVEYFNNEINILMDEIVSNNLLFKKSIYIIIFKLIIISSWLWIINLFNFMDGMDGLTASQICTFSMGITLLSILNFLSKNETFLGLIILSTCLGFFYWNKSPAKIFLGDVGSIPLGFMVGFFITNSLITHHIFFPMIILILFFLFDSTFTLLKRLLSRKNILKAHSDHLYQKKIRSGHSHNYILKRINYANLILLFCSILYFKEPNISILISIIVIIYLLLWLSGKVNK